MPWYLEIGTIRTKYLTQEQIEEEGWIYDHTLSGGSKDTECIVFKKEENVVSYRLEKYENHSKINISGWYHDNPNCPNTQTLYRGNCKSKNELEKLMQMLHINTK